MQIQTLSGGWPEQTLSIHGGMVSQPIMKKLSRVKIWVKKKHLIKACTRLTDENYRQIKGGKLSFSWEINGDEINVNCISDGQRKNYGIPDNDKLAALVAAYKTDEQREAWEGSNDSSLSNEADRIYHLMEAAKLQYHTYYNQIGGSYTVNKDTCKLFAQRWAVWQWISQNYSRTKNSLTIYHAAYSMVFPGHLCDVNSFSNFKKACDLKGIEAKVIDQRAISKAAKRITSFQYTLMQGLYIQPQKITAKAAHAKLIAACEGINETAYSHASVKLYFREFEHNAELYAARYGAAKAQKQLVHATLLGAEHRNTQWQIDGWTMPFWGDKFQRYVLYLVRDNHSRKIIGSSIATSENTTLILEGLEDAMRNTGVFPGELVSDKHSFHRTQVAARLKTETERMGAVWTITINAQRNQLAERYNQHLDTLCKEFPGYTGKNMTATGKDARPSAEALTETAKPANWKTEAEIRTIAGYVVKEFNKSPLEPLNGISPNDAYAASEDRKCFLLSETDRLQLLRPVCAYKVQRGQITIKVGMRKHEFQLPAELIGLYNNRLLSVVYEDLEQGIYISDPKSGKELGCIMPKPKIHGAIPDQTDYDRKLINQLTGRTKGTTVQARKTAQAKIAEALKDNPEAIALINHYSMPKDIRALAMQDNELQRAMADQGISRDMLPIRTVKAAMIPMPESKSKKSPFSSGAVPMEVMSLDDLANEF
jgi:transposase InsO family protein